MISSAPNVYAVSVWGVTVLARVGRVAERLDLLAKLSQIHNTFHVSQLRKCMVDDSVIVPLEDI